MYIMLKIAIIIILIGLFIALIFFDKILSCVTEHMKIHIKKINKKNKSQAKHNVNDISTIDYSSDSSPYIYPKIEHNVLTRDECKQIIDLSKDKLKDSETIGGKFVDVRNSQQTFLNKNIPIVKELIEKMSKKYNIPFENAEDLQVVRYLPGQYYKEHHDSCCDKNKDCDKFIKSGGQRILTVLIYLNDEFTDGETQFKNLNLKLKAAPGDAIVFYPMAKDQVKCHPKALHAGLPVSTGCKFVANIWFREHKFEYAH